MRSSLETGPAHDLIEISVRSEEIGHQRVQGGDPDNALLEPALKSDLYL